MMTHLASGSLFLIAPRNVASNDKEAQASEGEKQQTLEFCKTYTAKLDEKKFDRYWGYSASPNVDRTGERLIMTGDLGKDLLNLMGLLSAESKKEVWEQLRPHALNVLV
jgi:hypothetical protein